MFEDTIPSDSTELIVDAYSGCENINKIFIDQYKEDSKLIVPDDKWGASDDTIIDYKIDGILLQFDISKLKTVHFGAILNDVESQLTVDWDDGNGEQIIQKTDDNFYSFTYQDSDTTTIKNVKISNNIKDFGSTSYKRTSFNNKYTQIGLDSVTILNYAFYNCKSLQSITIPNSVTSIGSRTFYDCTSLQSITIPNSVTSIGDYAFSSCKSLQSITIPNSVTSIGDYAFYNCTNIITNKTMDEINAMTNKYWGVASYTIIYCSDGMIYC